jgi:hypothetical protein
MHYLRSNGAKRHGRLILPGESECNGEAAVYEASLAHRLAARIGETTGEVTYFLGEFQRGFGYVTYVSKRPAQAHNHMSHREFYISVSLAL